MTLSSVSGQRLASYLAHDIHLLYHLPNREGYMDSHFYAFTIYFNTKDVIKTWVKEPTKFRQTPTNTYKTRSLKKVFQYLILLCYQIKGQKSTKPSLKVGFTCCIMLEQGPLGSVLGQKPMFWGRKPKFCYVSVKSPQVVVALCHKGFFPSFMYVVSALVDLPMVHRP